MNDHVNGQPSKLPEQWQEALRVMRESITQATEAMRLLNEAMTELKPLFESAEALHREFSELTGGMAATPIARPTPAVSVAAAAAAPAAPAAEVAPQRVANGSSELPEVLRVADAADLQGTQRYTLSFKSEGPVDMMKVHTALESIAEISGMSLSDYGPNSAELTIWTASEPRSLPLVEALKESFHEVPHVEPTEDGLLVHFRNGGGAEQ